MSDVIQCPHCKGWLFDLKGHRHCAPAAQRARNVAAQARQAQTAANLASPDHWTIPEGASA